MSKPEPIGLFDKQNFDYNRNRIGRATVVAAGVAAVSMGMLAKWFGKGPKPFAIGGAAVPLAVGLALGYQAECERWVVEMDGELPIGIKQQVVMDPKYFGLVGGDLNKARGWRGEEVTFKATLRDLHGFSHWVTAKSTELNDEDKEVWIDHCKKALDAAMLGRIQLDRSVERERNEFTVAEIERIYTLVDEMGLN